MEKNGFQTPRKGYLAFYIVDKSKGFIDRLPFRKEFMEIRYKSFGYLRNF